MASQVRLTVHPDPGVFQPDSFRDLLQHEVHIPGLDTSWTHTLIAVAVADDGGSAELTVRSEPVAATSLNRHLRIVGTPAAHVRVLDPQGAVLAETRLSAPLRHGQEVDVAGSHWTVVDHSWPGRHPETGACAGDLDWQHVTVASAPRPPVVPTASP